MAKIELSEKQIEFLIRALINNFAHQTSDFEEDIASQGINGDLIEKLTFSTPQGMDYFDSARSNQYLRDPLKKELFLGAGWHSAVAIASLHKRLKFAVSELGGCQQNGGMGTAFDEKMDQEAKDNIIDVIKDIMIAFGVSADELK